LTISPPLRFFFYSFVRRRNRHVPPCRFFTEGPLLHLRRDFTRSFRFYVAKPLRSLVTSIAWRDFPPAARTRLCGSDTYLVSPRPARSDASDSPAHLIHAGSSDLAFHPELLFLRTDFLLWSCRFSNVSGCNAFFHPSARSSPFDGVIAVFPLLEDVPS